MSLRFGNGSSIDWLEIGGTALNGIAYGPPSSANAYGLPGCALVPRIFRVISKDIELPTTLTGLVGILGLKLSDLDSSAWQRFPGQSLHAAFLRELNLLLSDLPVPEQEIAVPAGIPYFWLVGLPLSSRLRNTLIRHFHRSFKDQSFPVDIDCREFLSIRNCGIKALVELLCVIESAELGYSSDYRPESPSTSRQRVITDSEFQAALQQAVQNAVGEASAASLYLKEFSEWALSETQAVTLGSALAYAEQISYSPKVWRVLSELRLEDLVAPRLHPYKVIDIWVADLPERDRAIFLDRIVGVDRKATLQELANRLAVSRERIRQVEKKLLRRFESHLSKASGLPVKWRAETIRNAIGVAMPFSQIEHLLLQQASRIDYGHVLLYVAGPYDIRGGWVILRKARDSDPTEKVLENFDEFGFIDQDFAATELSSWGLDSSLHREWLLATGKLRELSGRLVRWDVGIGDKIVTGLADLGKPATLDEVLDHIHSDRARSSAVNAISADPRIVRVNVNQFGLTSWGVTEYVSIVSTLRDLVVSSGGSIRLNDAVSTINKNFGVAESSVRTYCGAPMFVLYDGWVSLRQDLSTFRYETYSPRASRGVFKLDCGRLSLLLEVNEELLRGSGRPLPPPVGALLELAINEESVFYYTSDLSVTLTYPESSFAPSIGSLRPLAETVGAKLGEYLTVILDIQNMSVQCSVTDITNRIPSWHLVAQLTGVDIEDPLNGLAEALDCREGEVRALLKGRGDSIVADMIPTKSLASSSLEEALALLEAQLGPR